MSKSRRARIKQIKDEAVRLSQELSELGKPEQFNELEGYDGLLAQARKLSSPTEREVEISIKTTAKLKFSGKVDIPEDFDPKTWDAWEEIDADYPGLVDGEGYWNHEELIRGLLEVTKFCEEAKQSYVDYIAALNSFCLLHGLDDEEREELLGELESIVEEEQFEEEEGNEDEEYEDEDEDDVPF